jgi:hypothetical protein
MNALVIVLLISLAACATPAQHSIEEWQAAETHNFPDVDVSMAEKAIAAVFDSSRSGYLFSRTEEGMRVLRDWNYFLVITIARGREAWDIRISQAKNGITARATMATARFSPPGRSPPLDDPAVLKLLWMRADYVLGKQPDWMTCDRYFETMADPKSSHNAFYGLCGYLTDDKPPERLMPVAQAR